MGHHVFDYRGARLWVTTAALIALLSTRSHGQVDADKLALSIRPSIREIVPFEPLLVTVTLRNKSSKPVKLERQNYHFHLQFYCRVDGMPFRFCAFSEGLGIRRHGPLYELLPEEAFVWDELLFWRHPEYFNKDIFVFPRPGKYRIKAKTKGLESNVVELVVKRPSQEGSSAAKLITRPHVARLLQDLPFDSGEETRRAVVALNDFLVKYPNSPFADYAHYCLGRVANLQFFTRHYKTPEHPLTIDAYEHFGAVSRRIPGLRIRAANCQLFLLWRVPRLRNRAEFCKLKRELSTDAAARETMPKSLRRPRDVNKLLRAMNVIFDPDDRLDIEVRYRAEKEATLRDLLDHCFRETGVHLRIEPVESEQQKLRPLGDVSMTLREYMLGSTSPGNRYWKRDKKGYRHVLEEKPASSKKDEKPTKR